MLLREVLCVCCVQCLPITCKFKGPIQGVCFPRLFLPGELIRTWKAVSKQGLVIVYLGRLALPLVSW